MADEGETPAEVEAETEAVAVEEVQMSVLDALKEVSRMNGVVRRFDFNVWEYHRLTCKPPTLTTTGPEESKDPWGAQEGTPRVCEGS